MIIFFSEIVWWMTWESGQVHFWGIHGNPIVVAFSVIVTWSVVLVAILHPDFFFDNSAESKRYLYCLLLDYANLTLQWMRKKLTGYEGTRTGSSLRTLHGFLLVDKICGCSSLSTSGFVLHTTT